MNTCTHDVTQKKHERRCIFFFFFRAGPNDAPFRDDLRLPRGIFSFISRLLSSSSLRSKTFSHPRRLVKCIIKIRTQKRHFYLPFVWRGKKRLRNVAKNLFFLGGFFLHFDEAELLIFLHEAKSIQQSSFLLLRFFVRKKKRHHSRHLHYSIRAHKHTHHIYSAFGQTTDS